MLNFCFDSIDFSSIITYNENNNNNDNNKDNKDTIYNDNINNSNELKNEEIITFDKTTCETYRIKRIFKIDPLTDIEVPENLAFKFFNSWNPYTGTIISIDPIGPLYFNAISLYDYYFLNRYKGLWNPPENQYQGYYGDLIGSGKNIKITSRGFYPERYLYRIPIIDCYLSPNHNYSHITMGPELSDDDISQIDKIVCNNHPFKSHYNFASLTMLKYYYDRSLELSPDQDFDEIKELKIKYPSLNQQEINEKFNRYWVDKLVKIKYN